MDLKSENILLNSKAESGEEYTIKIIDLGLNKFMGADNYLQYKLGQAKKGGSVSSSHTHMLTIFFSHIAMLPKL